MLSQFLSTAFPVHYCLYTCTQLQIQHKLFICIVNSFLDVCKYLLSYHGVEAIFSERFNQDPLESFFGKHRSFGGRCDNPTVKDFVFNTTSLRLQGALAKDPVRGNCKRRSSERADLIDDTPLPKRKRYSAKKKIV